MKTIAAWVAGAACGALLTIGAAYHWPNQVVERLEDGGTPVILNAKIDGGLVLNGNYAVVFNSTFKGPLQIWSKAKSVMVQNNTFVGETCGPLVIF